MSEVLPFSEVKAHLSELADRVEIQHDRIMVTRNGRPSFVLMSPGRSRILGGNPKHRPRRRIDGISETFS